MGWGCTVAECSPSMHEALSSVLKKKKKKSLNYYTIPIIPYLRHPLTGLSQWEDGMETSMQSEHCWTSFFTSSVPNLSSYVLCEDKRKNHHNLGGEGQDKKNSSDCLSCQLYSEFGNYIKTYSSTKTTETTKKATINSRESNRLGALQINFSPTTKLERYSLNTIFKDQ